MAPLTTITLTTPTIKTLHKTPYPAISPLRPELSQAGKTVLIAGGSSGIGYTIARAFVQAHASRVILLGRRSAVVTQAATTLASESPSSTTTVTPLVCDITNLSDTASLFASFKKDNIFIDVLVLNAATTGPMQTLLDAGASTIWKAYEFNVRALLDLTDHFYHQEHEGKRQKYLVNVSTSAIHNFETDAPVMPAYGLTKNAGTLLLQQIAKDVSPDEMQIVSFHPGGVMTELAKANGVSGDLYDWDDENLPGQFAVWLASPEARFAHGRMLAAHWDVDELKGEEVRKAMEGEWNYLKVGVIGV
ncbi:hypothetical protein QBC34DRAFT_475286 [Podospora aff. communis PSN243]|uniref:NAD(P)-binding protein n=1 Tax=Podospora aff. communis PSN243 TaxID=3040156 RepID=A0AAV9G7T7_9PEZI|nr:hypothetical protein QBC34DRAFT_475286 [Podospora aff. communis PSN243]